jgi:hypothetical protein
VRLKLLANITLFIIVVTITVQLLKWSRFIRNSMLLEDSSRGLKMYRLPFGKEKK